MLTPKRYAIAMFTLATVAGLTSSALGNGVKAAEPGQDTYMLSVLQITYPFTDSVVPGTPARSDLAGVAYTANWSGASYPGKATCRIELFGADASRSGLVQFGLDSLSPSFSPDPIPVDVMTPPVRANGFCGAGVKPDPDARYAFSGAVIVRGEANLATPGEETVLHATAHWATAKRPGIQECTAILQMMDGTTGSYKFKIDVGDGDILDILLPGSFTDVSVDHTPSLSCKSFSGVAV